MSAPREFPDLPTALAAYAASQCKRWVRVDGWQIDLVKAQAEAGRVRDWTPMTVGAIRACMVGMCDRDEHDRWVASNVRAELRAELARAAAPVELPPLAEPALPAPPDDASAYRCPWCSRPWGGAP
jgi:hypothetical protein